MMNSTYLKKSVSYFLVAAVMSLAACGNNTDTEGTTDDTTATMGDAMGTTTGGGQQAVANLSGTFPDTALNGTVQFDQQNGKVQMNLDITVPSKANKSVAVHIHEHGDCGDTAQHAGGHWNPTNTQHGQWGKGSFHSGDIGNVQLDANGKGTMQLETDLWSIGGDAKTNILNKAIVVHGGVDDYTSQPAGNSGPRIGCGEIRMQGQ